MAGQADETEAKRSEGVPAWALAVAIVIGAVIFFVASAIGTALMHAWSC